MCFCRCTCVCSSWHVYWELDESVLLSPCVCVWVGGLLLNATEWVECVQTSRNVTCQPVCRALLWRVQPRYESYLTWEWWRDATGRHLRIIDSINLTWPSFAQRNKKKIKKAYNSVLRGNSTHALNETAQTHRPKQNKAPKLCQTFVFLNSDFTSDYRQHTDVHGRLRISFPLSLSCSALNSAELILRLIKSTLKSSLCRTQCFFHPLESLSQIIFDSPHMSTSV